MPNNVDVLICSMPLMVDLGRVPGAPAMLKAAAQNAGYSAMALDLNLEYFNQQTDRDLNKYYNFGSAWRPFDPPSAEANAAASNWVCHCIKIIKDINPKVLAISVFTNWQHRSSWALLNALKQQSPQIPIIVGGMGCETNSNSLNGISKLDQLKPFWQLLTNNDLVEYVALGSGGSLDDFVSFLDCKIKNVEFKKANVAHAVIYDAPIPDYSDYDFDQYIWENQKNIAITGSKGCVRACTFCDIPGQFGRFKYRQGKDIAQEMIHQSEKHEIYHFEFTDSLVNGSLKAFREWLTIIAEHNDKVSENKKIKWFGQYICRPQTQVSDEIYDLMVRSGVSNLIIGVESGSNEVLDAMNKKIKVEDVYDELEQFSKRGIVCSILMISGFYNETYDLFKETLIFLQKCQKYLANGTITSLGMGPPLFISDQMSIGQHADDLGIIRDKQNDFLWTLKDDPENTFINRVKRRVAAQLVLDLLGYPLSMQHISILRQIHVKLSQLETNLLQELNESSQSSSL